MKTAFGALSDGNEFGIPADPKVGSAEEGVIEAEGPGFWNLFVGVGIECSLNSLNGLGFVAGIDWEFDSVVFRENGFINNYLNLDGRTRNM